MNNNTLLIALVALLVGGTGGYMVAENRPVLNSAPNLVSNTVPRSMPRTPGGSMMGNADSYAGMGMMGGMGMMMVASEKEFITEMIPHHQEAVDTAREVLARGATTPEVRTLVQNIISAQEKEIADMKSWYLAWYGTPYQPSGTYRPMMRDLSNLSGVELDRAFLEDMVMHHMGAIMMAHSVQSYIEHDEVRTLTNAIIRSQSDEIQQMRRILAGF